MIAFLNPALLVALPLAMIPLWLRPRPKRIEPQTVPFAATHLLAAAAAPVLKRRRLRHWLVTTLRILIIALAVLGFARPYHPLEILSTNRPGPAGVTILAEPRQFIAAALGDRLHDGPNRLVFLGDAPTAVASVAGTEQGPWEQDLGLRLVALHTGDVTIATGPYFHPALAGLDDAFRQVHVRRWWKLEPTGRTFVLARLSNGDPFLVEHWSRPERDGAETCRTITCASAADLDWNDLPVHAGFVPLVRGLEKYLSTAAARAVAATTNGGRPPPAHQSVADCGRWLCGAALLLAVAELALGGFGLWKLLGLGVLAVSTFHPTFAWKHRSPAKLQNLWLIADRTESMASRETALAQALAAAPSGHLLTLRGDHTALGETLLSLTNHPVDSVILFSDGQHNRGVHPALGALWLDAPVFTVAVGPPAPALASEGGSPPSHSGNSEPSMTRIRVYLRAASPNWEYRHVRHALQQDAGLELIDTEASADVVLPVDGDTWRWRRYGDGVFQRYWSERVRAEYRARHGEKVAAPAVTDSAVLERTRLWRNDAALEEIARVSGGRMFTTQNLAELRDAVRRARSISDRQRRQRSDLRDSRVMLLALAGLFIVSWRPRDSA